MPMADEATTQEAPSISATSVRLATAETTASLSFQISCDFGELGEGGLEVFDNLGGDDVWVSQAAMRCGISSYVLPLSWRPVICFRTPPHCLKKNGTSDFRHARKISRTHSTFIGRANGPDSPPTITQ